MTSVAIKVIIKGHCIIYALRSTQWVHGERVPYVVNFAFTICDVLELNVLWVKSSIHHVNVNTSTCRLWTVGEI